MTKVTLLAHDPDVALAHPALVGRVLAREDQATAYRRRGSIGYTNGYTSPGNTFARNKEIPRH